MTEPISRRRALVLFGGVAGVFVAANPIAEAKPGGGHPRPDRPCKSKHCTTTTTTAQPSTTTTTTAASTTTSTVVSVPSPPINVTAVVA